MAVKYKKTIRNFTLLIHTVGGYLFTQLVDRAAVIYTVLQLNASASHLVRYS